MTQLLNAIARAGEVEQLALPTLAADAAEIARAEELRARKLAIRQNLLTAAKTARLLGYTVERVTGPAGSLTYYLANHHQVIRLSDHPLTPTDLAPPDTPKPKSWWIEELDKVFAH